MAKENKQSDLQNLPGCIAEFIKQVLRKMRYRRKVRLDVQTELAAHFEDELKDCATAEEKEQKAERLISDFGNVKLLAVLLRRAKKRCRPLWRMVVARTFQAVGMLILCFVFYTIWFSCGKPMINIDYLVLLNQMNQPQNLDQDNAWPHYEKAIELYTEPDESILRLIDSSREAFKERPRFHDFSKEEQNKILEWVEQNESHLDKLDLLQKQLIDKCFQEGLVPLPYPYPTGRYMAFDEAVENILWRIERQRRNEIAKSSGDYYYDLDYEMMMEISTRSESHRRLIKLNSNAALDSKIIAWFASYSQQELNNIERGIEVCAIKKWISSPLIAAKSLFDCLLPFERKLIVKWTEDNEAAWRECAAGSRKPYCYLPYAYYANDEDKSLRRLTMPHLSALRKLSRLGIWRSRIDRDQGRIQQSIEHCLTIARAGSHLKGKAMLTEQLVGLAISRFGHEEILHIAEAQNLSAADLKQLYEQLSQLYLEGYPLTDIEGERLAFLDAVQNSFTDGGSGGGHLIPQRAHLLHDLYDIAEEIAEDIPAGRRFFESAALTSMCLLHARRDETVAKANQIYDQQSKIAKMTPYERHISDLKTGKEMIMSMPRYRFFLIQTFMPPVDRVSELAYRRKMQHEATVTILALRRWRLEKDEYPSTLGELVSAGFLNELPMDPYSDKPLVYKHMGDDFTLYSLGADFDNDGGVHSKWVQRKQVGDQVFWPSPKSDILQ